jgi:hypothetical protein
MFLVFIKAKIIQWSFVTKLKLKKIFTYIIQSTICQVHDVYLIQVAHLKACGDKTKLEKITW